MIVSPFQAFNLYQAVLKTQLAATPAKKPVPPQDQQQMQNTQHRQPTSSSLDSIGNGRLI